MKLYEDNKNFSFGLFEGNIKSLNFLIFSLNFRLSVWLGLPILKGGNINTLGNKIFEDDIKIYIYGSGHESATVLLPGFAIIW